jgi:membrane-bound lytic murein transglycosylase A
MTASPAWKRRSLSLLAAVGLVGLAACSVTPPPPPSATAPANIPDRLVLSPIGYDLLPGWGDDDLSQAVPALRRSCERFAAMPPSQPVGRDGRAGLAGDWLAPCGALRRVAVGDKAAARAYFETWFRPYLASNNGRAEGLFTGYYEAELRGSRRPGPGYPVPLYGRPPGLPLDPGAFLSRADIEAGKLHGVAPELLWVADPVDAHILQIQGSGRILLDDGTTVRVGFNGSNGQKFVGLGRILLDHGKLGPGQTTMPKVRAWLTSHPEEAPALMAENPRYVFFRLLPAAGEGPIGAAGVVLTPGRSLAVDVRFLPLGIPVWLNSRDPDGWPLRRLMVAQDAGAAIKGPVRGDVFWGTGDAAFDKAGRMQSPGSYYLLLLRQRSVPVAAASPGEQQL